MRTHTRMYYVHSAVLARSEDPKTSRAAAHSTDPCLVQLHAPTKTLVDIIPHLSLVVTSIGSRVVRWAQYREATCADSTV
jgi:hypothetical protein